MIKGLTALAAGSIAAAALTTKKAYAWKSSTHEHIVKVGLSLLENDGYIEASDFYRNYIDIILSCTKKPDCKGDIDKGKGWHYYCVTTVNGDRLEKSPSGYLKSGKNIMSPSQYARTARTIFEDNYQSALTFCAMGEKERAMEFVARCVHMLADICCTPHTTNLTLTSLKNSKHKRYEFYSSEIFSDYAAQYAPEEMYRLLAEDELFGNIINEAAELSSAKYDTVVGVKTNEELTDTVATALIYAQQLVSAFLLRFHNDAQQGIVFVENGKRYHIRNAETGEYLALAKARQKNAYFCITSADKKPSNLFTANINSDGSYSFVSQNAKILLSAMPYCPSDEKAVKPSFRIGRTPNGIRLTTSDSKFMYALTAGEQGRPAAAKPYNPDALSSHWIFEAE